MHYGQKRSHGMRSNWLWENCRISFAVSMSYLKRFSKNHIISVLRIIHRILEDGCESHSGDMPQKPQAVIVAPTRELAIQIKDEARKFSNGSVVNATVAYGGTSTGYQINQLMRGTNVLIATPGRLMDFVDKGKVSFEELKFLVLDEADRMLDMGFHPEVLRICSHSTMPAKGTRQTLMFSATFPSSVQHLALGKSSMHFSP